MAMLMVSSVLVGGLSGTVVAQEDTSAGEQAVNQCVDNVSGWGLLIPVYGGYECVSGAFEPSEYDSSSQLENEAWNNAISLQDAAEQRQTEYSNWEDIAQNSALQQAEEPIIEAHYASEDAGQARSAGQEVIRNFYSAERSAEYARHNEIAERAFSIGQSTKTADGVDTVVEVYYDRGASINNTTAYHEFTADSQILYDTVSLPNGEEMEVVVGYEGMENSSGTESAVIFYPSEVDNLSENLEEPNGASFYTYNSTDEVWESGNQVSGYQFNDPYSSDNRQIQWVQTHSERLNSIEEDYNGAQGQIETLVSDLYETHDTGTINPDEYVSAATLSEEYAQNDSHYSYAGAKASLLGLNTDLDTQQIVEVNGEEYEGMILTGSEGNTLADDEAHNFASSHENPVFSFSSDSEDTPATDTVEFESQYTVTDVQGANSEGVSIDGSSVTVDESALTQDYALFTLESDDGSGNTVTDTVVMYASEDRAEDGIPQGLEVGTEYTAGDFDGSVMLAYQSGDSASTMTLSDSDTFTITEATSASSGEEIQTLEYKDGNQRTYTDTSNLTEELQRTQDIQEAFEQRDDVDPAGAGHSTADRITDGLIGFVGGIGVVFFAGGIIVVLYLVGRITSIA